MSEATTLPRLNTAREVADATGIPLSRVYELTRAESIPHVRLGRAVRYDAAALAAWIAGGGTGAWSPAGSTVR